MTRDGRLSGALTVPARFFHIKQFPNPRFNGAGVVCGKIYMNPIEQRLLGMSALIGFTLTFLSGSPIVDDAMGLVLRSVAGGAIFGSLGYVAGSLIHHFVSERMEEETRAFLLKKELKRQEKLQKAQETRTTILSKPDDDTGPLDDGILVETVFGRGDEGLRGA